MPRPRKAIRPVEKSISLPETVVARVDLLLWSELEGKVPAGAWAKYVQRLVEQDLDRISIQQQALAKESWGAKYVE